MSTSFTDFEIATPAPVAKSAPDQALPRTVEGVLWGSLILLVRAGFALFWLLTSTYCLLVYVPFAYFGFIKDPLLNWLPAFTRYHAGIYAVLCCAVSATFLPELRSERTRKAYLSFALLNALASAYLCWHPAIAGVTPDLASYFWSMVSLFPLVWLAVLDLDTAGDVWQFPADPFPANLLLRAILGALAVSFSFSAAAFLHAALEQHPIPSTVAFRGLFASLSFHFVIFLGLGSALAILRWASAKVRRPGRLYEMLAGALACLLCTQALRMLVLPTISFEGTQADIFALSVSLTLVLYVAALCAKFHSGITALTRFAEKLGNLKLLPLLLAALIVIAYATPLAIGHADWDFVLQKIVTLTAWVLVFQVAGCLRVPALKKASLSAITLLCVAAGSYAYVRVKLDDPGTQILWNDSLETYAGADISFKTAYSILSESLDNRADQPFYDFLKQNTNLDRNMTVGPVDARLVEHLEPSTASKPHVFVFVIDSLRQDSLSPYNQAVDYTPEIGRFAQDSVVFRNAFARYGGTALSEPSIWVGAMQLHKQYIEPFYPMNNLQQMLDADGYHSYISFDPILRRILKPSQDIIELDNDKTGWGNLDFVPTLKKLETAIDGHADEARPIFVYSQPQNVHTLTLERSRMKGGRKAITAYELRRMDDAFGTFVRFLQARGLYDNSIIILTADHGDAYGEFGRYGHSDFLFPEVIRIPLIVHLPKALRQKYVWDVQQASFTTDITPTLYYLLGHRPTLKNELFGRPLFTQTALEQVEYARPYYLLVSSYAPVYAILANNGQSLFIVDAVNSKHYFYDLRQDPEGLRNHVTPFIVSQNEPLIRQQIQLIDKFYGWHSSAVRP